MPEVSLETFRLDGFCDFLDAHERILRAVAVAQEHSNAMEARH